MASRPGAMPKEHAAFLRNLAKVDENASLPLILEDTYTSLRRLAFRLGRELDVRDIMYIGFIAGMGMEPFPERTIAQLYHDGEVKKGDTVEFKMPVRPSSDPRRDTHNWATGRITGFSPSKGFVITSEPGGMRYEVKHEDVRLIKPKNVPIPAET